MRILRSQYKVCEKDTAPSPSVQPVSSSNENSFESVTFPGAQQQHPRPVQSRRHTMVSFDEQNPGAIDTGCGNVKIKFINAHENMGTVNVIVQFYNEGNKWYTDLYKSYEDDIWRRVLRERGSKKQKWYFICEFCGKQLCSFSTLKAHLNHHFKVYPNYCEECPKKYTSRTSLIRHHKLTQHAIPSGNSAIKN